MGFNGCFRQRRDSVLVSTEGFAARGFNPAGRGTFGGHGLGAVGHAQFLQNHLHVIFDCVLRHAEPAADFLVAVAF